MKPDKPHIPGTPGGVAYRVNKRAMSRPNPERVPYRGDTEAREALQQSLFSKDGQEILVVIVEQAKKWRSETFAPGKLPEQRLFAIEHIAIYRDLVEKIFAKADLQIPQALSEVLN